MQARSTYTYPNSHDATNMNNEDKHLKCVQNIISEPAISIWFNFFERKYLLNMLRNKSMENSVQSSVNFPLIEVTKIP